MIDQIVLDLPILALFMKFMIASTLLLGGVWVLEKIGVINSPDMSESAWKLAIFASFVALLPVSFTSNNLVIPINETVANEYAIAPESRQTAPAPAPQPEITPAERPVLRSEAGAELISPDAQQRIGELREQYAQRNNETSIVETPVVPDTRIDASLADNTAAFTPSADTLLIAAWVSLALIALIALVASYSRAIKSLGDRTRVPAEHHANRTLRALCEQVDIRHVPYLSRSSAINSPVCLPRREICLPDWAFEDMDEKALDSLIAHELAHMLRRDPVMMIFTQTLCRVFFFQPLFTLARKRLEDNAELAADQWAATHLSTARAVANALYTCAQKITEKRQLQWGLAMAGDKSILKQRVERLLKAEGSSFNTAGRIKRGGIAAILLAAVISLPSVEFATAMSAGHPHDIPDEEEIERMVRRIERKIERDVRPLERELLRSVRPLEGEIAREVAEATAEAVRLAASAAEIAAEVSAEAAAEIAEELARHPEIKHHFETGGFQSGNMQWSDDGETVKVEWDGRFELTDDERGIKRIRRGGEINIRTEDHDGRRRIRMENDRGDIETTYWVDGRRADMDAAGEEWLAGTIQKLVRHTAIDIENRVERYLDQGGTKLAFQKFDELETDYVRRAFAVVLVEEARLDRGETKKLFKALKVIDSDYELRLVLSVMLDEGLITKDTLNDALGLTSSIESDYELRLVLTPMLEEFAFDDRNMKQVLERAQTIESDYELRLLLASAMDSGRLSDANQKLLVKAATSIESDYELRLVIGQFADEADMDAELTKDLLNTIQRIDSDYEKRLALSSVIDEGEMTDDNWLLAIDVASKIDGDYEKRLVLSQIKDDMPSDSKIQSAFWEAAETISGDYERELLGVDDRR